MEKNRKSAPGRCSWVAACTQARCLLASYIPIAKARGFTTHWINKGKWLIVAFLPLWYNIQRCRTQSGNRKGVYSWKLLYPFWFPLWQA